MSRTSQALIPALSLIACLTLAGCPGGGSGGAPSGRYEAKTPDGGSMTLDFKSGGKVHLVMSQKGAPPDASDGDFLVDGNRVTIQIPGGIPMVLTRNGDALEGDFAGQVLRFMKK